MIAATPARLRAPSSSNVSSRSRTRSRVNAWHFELDEILQPAERGGESRAPYGARLPQSRRDLTRGRGCGSGHRRSSASRATSASGSGRCAEIGLHVALQVLGARAEDRLQVVADLDDSGRTERLEAIGIRPLGIHELHAKPRDAGIEALDVGAPAERRDQLAGQSSGAGRAAGCADFDVLLPLRDQASSDRIGESRRGTGRSTSAPRSGRATRNHKPCVERLNSTTKSMRPCENVMPCLMPSSMQTKYATAARSAWMRVEQRRHEQERELDRLGDSGQKRRERRRDHDAADLRAVLRPRAVPDRDGGSRQSPHLEQIPAGHVAGCRISGRVTMDLAADDRSRSSGRGTGRPRRRTARSRCDADRTEGAPARRRRRARRPARGSPTPPSARRRRSPVRSAATRCSGPRRPTMHASAVTIGTKRLPAKKPRYGGS